MQSRRRRTTVDDGGANQNVVDIVFRVFDEDVEVAVLVEDSGVDQLVFGVRALPLAVSLHQVLIRERGLRILVQRLHVGVRRRGVQVIVVFLDILAMIALWPRDSEETLLENRIYPVPKSEREAQALVVVADAGDAILGPAISARAGMIVGEVIPGRAVGAVILARIAPGSFREVRAPASPVRRLVSSLEQAISFSVHRYYGTTGRRNRDTEPRASSAPGDDRKSCTGEHRLEEHRTGGASASGFGLVLFIYSAARSRIIRHRIAISGAAATGIYTLPRKASRCWK